jgi:hypothetical protein
MAQLVPEFRDMLTEADAFVLYVQQRLMRDQEAFLREQRNGKPTGESGPRPTTSHHPEEDERA